MTDQIVLQLLVPKTPATIQIAEGDSNPLVVIFTSTCARCGGRLEAMASGPGRWHFEQAMAVRCTACHAEFIIDLRMAQTRAPSPPSELKRQSVARARAVKQRRREQLELTGGELVDA